MQHRLLGQPSRTLTQGHEVQLAYYCDDQSSRTRRVLAFSVTIATYTLTIGLASFRRARDGVQETVGGAGGDVPFARLNEWSRAEVHQSIAQTRTLPDSYPCTEAQQPLLHPLIRIPDDVFGVSP
jgi:hypothetical protein